MASVSSRTVFNFLLVFGNYLNIIIYDYTHFFECLLDIYIKNAARDYVTF